MKIDVLVLGGLMWVSVCGFVFGELVLVGLVVGWLVVGWSGLVHLTLGPYSLDFCTRSGLAQDNSNASRQLVPGE